MTISKKLLLIIILNIPTVFNIFTQSNLEIIKNYSSNFHNQNPSTKQATKIARWLDKKLDNLSYVSPCQYYTDEKEAEANLQRERMYDPNYKGPVFATLIRDCSGIELTNYSKEEVTIIAQIIQNYPNTREAILKALISDEKAEQLALDAKVKLYNAQQQENEDYISDIWNTDTRPRWLKNKLIQYMTSPLSDNESTVRFIDL